MIPRAAVLALVLAAVPATVAGQDLMARVTSVADGTVRFRYATRPDVQICDRGIRMGEDDHMIWQGGRWDDHDPRNCRYGPAEVEVEVRADGVRDVTILVPWRSATEGAADLGEVPADVAADFFRSVAMGAGSDRAAKEAIFPLVLIDIEEVWRPLLAVARDARAPRGARKNALFWVGQEAAAAATVGLADVAWDEEEDQDVRDAAVFALSQRPADEGVPILMELARDADQAETRRKAMFWLAQSGDERVVRFFEEILLGTGR